MLLGFFFGGVRGKSVLPSLDVLTHDIVHCPLSIVLSLSFSPSRVCVCVKRDDECGC